MGGQDAIRGFAIQSLLCLFDALDGTNRDWIAVTVEPDIESEKVDILWEHPSFHKAQQVKSSRLPIGRAAVADWCRELAQSRAADRYELLLAGPVTQTALDEAPYHGVHVPMPRSVDIFGLIEQAVTKLDRYLGGKGVPQTPLVLRETLVTLVAGRITDGSVVGRRMTREEFDGMLLYWITAAYPDAVRHRLQVNCEVLWNEVELVAPRLARAQAFDLILPLSVVNGGPAVCVVDWFAVRVQEPSGGLTMHYLPNRFVAVTADARGDAGARSDVGFGAFAVMPNSVREMRVRFALDPSTGDTERRWEQHRHVLELYVMYRGSPSPILVHATAFDCSPEHFSGLGGGPAARINFSQIEL